MGVPKFYRWLSERYPLINQPVDENTLLPEIDNLYLDLNGAIHTATHGDGISKRQTMKDVVIAVMTMIDSAVQLTRPRKLLYMAVDGVAPRAKMNQQRSRRFRAARDLEEQRDAALAKGEDIKEDEVFDSNCITPGTEFMAEVSKHLKYFVRRKIKEDPVWRRMQVIFSGQEVPGEGEHKIVQYIRTIKMAPDYDPNTKHCMSGLDADLIMLALATHEPHFTLLREQVDFMSFKSNKFGTKTATRATTQKKMQLLHIGLLREYLEIDMKPADVDTPPAGAASDFVYDGERVIDDFVLMTALCGNDFLPHLPSLDIGEGAIDTLFRVYRENLLSWGGYLTDGGLINMERLGKLLQILGAMEEEIFKARAVEAARFAAKQKRAKRKVGDAVLGLSAGVGEEEDAGDEPDEDVGADDAKETALTAARLAAATNQMTGGISDEVAVDARGREIRIPPSPVLSPSPATFKTKYYGDKFGIIYGVGRDSDNAILSQLKQSYVEALQWVMLYYYRGCPSWGWFFPFHYAPMTSDLSDIASINVSFRLGRPFLPFQQLLGCLPAASASFLPAPYRRLMIEEWSPLKEFYPILKDIKIDMDGKRNPWEGITLIPFIKENIMLEAITAHAPDSLLTAEEKQRNSFGEEYIISYDESQTDTLISSLAGVFPDVLHAHSRIEVFRPPVMPVLSSTPVLARSLSADREVSIRVDAAGMAAASCLYSARPRPGCTVPAPGYPTLHTLPFTPMLTAVKMNVFGLFSKKDSLILGIGEGRKDPDLIDEEESDAMLAVAGLHIFDGERADPSRSPALDPLAAPHPAPLPLTHKADGEWPAFEEEVRPAGWLPSHRPVFSIEYAAGTTAHDGISRCDIWSMMGLKEPHLDAERASTTRNLAQKLLGRVVYVDWPFLREAMVVGVSDAASVASWHGDETFASTQPISVFHSNTYSAKKEDIEVAPHTADEAMRWNKRANDLRLDLLSGRQQLGIAGINLGKPLMMLTVRKLIGMRRDPATGALSRVWAAPESDGEIEVLSELVLQKNPAVDVRFEPHPALTLQDRFPPNTPVVVVRGDARGCVGTVVARAENDGLLNLNVEMTAPEPPFGHTVCSTLKDVYMDAKRAADRLGISPTTLGKITGSVILNPGHFDIGLNLKVNKYLGQNKGSLPLYLPGYVRNVVAQTVSSPWGAGANSTPAAKPTGGWEYTERAIQLVAAYQRVFPFVFAIIESAPNEPSYSVKTFPGRGETIAKISTYLQQLDTYKRPLVPLSTQFVSPPAILALEKAADAWKARTAKPVNKLVTGISPADVFKHEINAYAVGSVGEGGGSALSASNVDGPSCLPQLGDRVANLSFRNAPLGSRGTVVAVHSATAFVEVLFDVEFVGGTTLGGLCSGPRGALVPWSALLCLSRLPTAATAAEATAAIDVGPRGKRGIVASASPDAAPKKAHSTPKPSGKPANTSAAPKAAPTAVPVSVDSLFASVKAPAHPAPVPTAPVHAAPVDVAAYWGTVAQQAGVVGVTATATVKPQPAPTPASAPVPATTIPERKAPDVASAPAPAPDVSAQAQSGKPSFLTPSQLFKK